MKLLRGRHRQSLACLLPSAPPRGSQEQLCSVIDTPAPWNVVRYQHWVLFLEAPECSPSYRIQGGNQRFTRRRPLIISTCTPQGCLLGGQAMGLLSGGDSFSSLFTSEGLSSLSEANSLVAICTIKPRVTLTLYGHSFLPHVCCLRQPYTCVESKDTTQV